MREAALSIAGVNLDFAANGVQTEYLFDELPGLFPGFLTRKKNTPDAVCLVHFDHGKQYPLRFQSEPQLIGSEDSITSKAIFSRMGEITCTSSNNYSQAIGFLNGCLTFDDRSNRGLIYIFCTEAANHFVATLLKLIFVFTCLVMANKGRIIVHGTGIKKAQGRGGYLFLGASGAGKSTIAAMSSGDVILSDDATVIEIARGPCRIHATPFRQVGSGQPFPRTQYLQQERLDKLLFLHQSSTALVRPREELNAFAELLREHLHCFEVMGESLKRQAFYLCRSVCEATPSYDLFFCKDPVFWELVLAK